MQMENMYIGNSPIFVTAFTQHNNFIPMYVHTYVCIYVHKFHYLTFAVDLVN